MSSQKAGWHVRPTSVVLSAVRDPHRLDHLLYPAQAATARDPSFHLSWDSAFDAARTQWAQALEEQRGPGPNLDRINKCLLILAAERVREFHKTQGKRLCVAGHLVGDDPYVSSWDRLRAVYRFLLSAGTVERVAAIDSLYQLTLR